jgi:SAM-dependent methyltransferase
VSAAAVSEPQPQFHADRPHDLRVPTPWHRLSFIVRALPERIEALAAELRVPPGARVLDYGCADVPYRRLFPADADYLAADLPGNPDATLEIRPDGTLPLEAASVDAVLSTQVLEHVTDPGAYLAECFRVLRPGGRLLLTTHGLMVYHPDPDDYWRWTGAGLRRAVREASFEVVRFEGIMGLTATALQLLQDSIYWRLPVPVRPLLALVLQSIAKLADRFETSETRAANALVFAVVAERP